MMMHKPCELENGDMVPTGRIFYDDPSGCKTWLVDLSNNAWVKKPTDS